MDQVLSDHNHCFPIVVHRLYTDCIHVLIEMKIMVMMMVTMIMMKMVVMMVIMMIMVVVMMMVMRAVMIIMMVIVMMMMTHFPKIVKLCLCPSSQV